MRALLVFAILFSSQVSFAGDGGYKAVSCVSASKRTVLTFFQDYYSGSQVPYIVNFSIDGLLKQYNPEMEWNSEFDGWSPINCEEECLVVRYDYSSRRLTVNEGDVPPLLDVTFSSDFSRATVAPRAFDPRSELGYKEMFFPNSISLECGQHEEGP